MYAIVRYEGLGIVVAVSVLVYVEVGMMGCVNIALK